MSVFESAARGRDGRFIAGYPRSPAGKQPGRRNRAAGLSHRAKGQASVPREFLAGGTRPKGGLPCKNPVFNRIRRLGRACPCSL